MLKLEFNRINISFKKISSTGRKTLIFFGNPKKFCPPGGWYLNPFYQHIFFIFGFHWFVYFQVPM